jgi:protein TonB
MYPIFPGCEKVDKSQRRDCFQDKMNKHIRKNFRYPEIAQEMGIQGRVYVNFIIAKDGQITNIRMRGPDKNLEKEAQRIISKLPSMTPGKQRGRPVRVPFSIPITFRLQVAFLFYSKFKNPAYCWVFCFQKLIIRYDY